MAIRPQSFLAVEKSITAILRPAWDRIVMPVAVKAAEALVDEDYEAFEEALASIDVTPIVEENSRMLSTLSVASLLFGISRIHRVRAKDYNQNPQHQWGVDRGLKTLKMLLQLQATRWLRNDIERFVKKYKARQEVQKAAQAFTREFVSFVDERGNAYFDIGSSLHTSRLAQWGYTVEAEYLEIHRYEISEVLDSRTCPLCNLMDGRSFDVAPAKRKLESLLSVENLDDMRTLAPFPKQNKAALERYSKMSEQELADNGLGFPPYHPRCRGHLIKSKEVEQVPATGLDRLNDLMGDQPPPQRDDFSVVENQLREEAESNAMEAAQDYYEFQVDGQLSSPIWGLDEDAKDIAKRLEWATQDHWDSLPMETVLYIQAYANNMFSEVNKTLAGAATGGLSPATLGGARDRIQAIVKNLDDALATAQMPNSSVVWRTVDAAAVGVTANEMLDIPSLRAKMTGQTITAPVYSSTTISKAVAVKHAILTAELIADAKRMGLDVSNIQSPARLILKIRAKKGTHALWLGSMGRSKYAGELEYLLERNSSFTVVGVESERVGGADIPVIVLDLL